jgi:peptidoglycan/xylan/chitin deacetylase (PgdA/CDA1 family)
MSALVLTYHGVEDASGPLFVTPELFERHLDTVLAWGGEVLTVGELGRALHERRLPERALAITFDDGFASVARVAAPMLLARGLTATVFCVAGHLGETNDWPSQPPGIPRRPLASPDEIADLVRDGLEIGAHGTTHDALTDGIGHDLELEIVVARSVLERVVGAEVRSFAYPYGAPPSTKARALVAETYSAACSTRPSRVTADSDALDLPRVDAHYLRDPRLFARALGGALGGYLAVRRVATSFRGRFLSSEGRRATPARAGRRES